MGLFPCKGNNSVNAVYGRMWVFVILIEVVVYALYGTVFFPCRSEAFESCIVEKKAELINGHLMLVESTFKDITGLKIVYSVKMLKSCDFDGKSLSELFCSKFLTVSPSDFKSESKGNPSTQESPKNA